MLESNEVERYYDEYSSWYDRERTGGYYSLINQMEFDIIKKYIQNKVILEVGCGTGILLLKTSRIARKAVGVDISEGMLKVAKQKGLDVKKADATKLPFKNDTFDVLYSCKVLPHIPEIKKAISEMQRVTKRGGIMILEFYNSKSLKYFINKIFNLLSGRKVFVRFDSLMDINKHLPNNLKLIDAIGIKILTVSNPLLNIKIFSELFLKFERALSESKLSKYGGYYLMVVKNEK